MDARIPPIRVTDERIEKTRNRALAKAENLSQYPLMELRAALEVVLR